LGIHQFINNIEVVVRLDKITDADVDDLEEQLFQKYLDVVEDILDDIINKDVVLEPKEKSSALETACSRDRKVAAGSEATTTKRWNAIPQIIMLFKERARAYWGVIRHVQLQFPRRTLRAVPKRYMY